MQDRAAESFSNVEVVTKANVYFEGKVVSHTVKWADGTSKTLGLIYPGAFHFGTDRPELMQITAGECRAKLDGESEWTSYAAGTAFRVPGKSGFDIEVASGIAEYVCSFE